MKTDSVQSSRYLFATLFLGAVVFSTSATAENYQAAHIASPEQYQLLLETDEVLVLKMVLQPGEADRMHSHHNETVYFQQGGLLTITEPGAGTAEVVVPDGHVMWHPAWNHQVSNSGDTAVIAIIVEQKQ